MSEKLQPIYGIDFGTTYSCIAVVNDAGRVEVISNLDNEPVTPSVVLFEDAENVVVGKIAKENAKMAPDRVVEAVKRSMGEKDCEYEFHGKTYKPEEIAALILRKLADDVKAKTGEEVTDVVITVPAYFGVNQREATAIAGEIAGLKVHEIINEPTAAAICYGVDQTDQVVLVYDLGGGTFDVTMIEIKSGNITVICTGGDYYLGGKNWDAAIVGYLADRFLDETGKGADMLADPETLYELSYQAEIAKKALGKMKKAPVRVQHGGETVRSELTRETFDEITAPLLKRTVTLTREMLSEAYEKGHRLFDKILLVGGSTKMQQVVDGLAAEFDAPCESFDPDEAVAKGAAIYARRLAIQQQIMRVMETENAVDPGSQLVRADDRQMLAAQEKVAQKFGIPSPAVKKATTGNIVNVASKSFGIAVFTSPEEEQILNLVKRNTAVPIQHTRELRTPHDGNRFVALKMMENSSLEDYVEMAECEPLGTGVLKLPPEIPTSSPFDVTIKLNEQGRLEVSAIEKTTNTSLTFEVRTSSVMSREQIDKAISKAKELTLR